MGAVNDANRSRKKSSSRGHHRTNFELPEATSGDASKRGDGGGSTFVPNCSEPFSFEDVNEPSEEAEGLLGALKAKLLDGKKGKFHFPFLPNSAASPLVQSGWVSTSTQNVCSAEKDLLLPSSASNTVLSSMNGTGANPLLGVTSTLETSNTCSKSVVIPNHDHEGSEGRSSRVDSHQLCQTPPEATWFNEVAYELPWPTQCMSQVPDNNNNSLLASAATLAWPLSEVIESIDMACPDQGPSNCNKSGQMMNMVSMQLPLVGGATEGLWTLEQQQFVQYENNSWFSYNGSWDPLLYVPSELA
ncbi:uncharacterized protein HKW66_Vig0066800 [Vigna angularis]|uniref:Uncharacterized protein n=1 Tax=Phaseolus angularis TaxID=3914 RepID=A0A8T0K8L1_PHAAN|nr:uncharacterized protein HKW66_Vig0066800 [Vigna angularis]